VTRVRCAVDLALSAACVVGLVGLVACSPGADDSSATAATVAASTVTSSTVVSTTVVLTTVASEPVADSVPDVGVVPEGFSTVLVEITKADGTTCEVCMWLADSNEERQQGLMGVTSLGEPEGMAFVWEQPRAGAFFMFQTVTPLSIAWFAEPPGDSAGGVLVSTADMDPCLSEDSGECERFPAGGEYVLAIEVFQGDLASIGITAGATARLLAGTEAASCPLT